MRAAVLVVGKGEEVGPRERGRKDFLVRHDDALRVRPFVFIEEGGVDEGAEFQLVERRPRFGGEGDVHGKFLHGNGEGNVRVDGRERVRKFRVLLARDEAVFHARREFVEMTVDILRRAVLLKEGERRLGADACNARDIVRAVAHERLLLDDLRGGEPDFLEEIVVREAVGVAHAALCETHRDVLVHELVGVPVSRVDDGLNVLIGAREGADEVVRLIALLLHIADAHGGEHLLERGELHDELLRRRRAGALVVLEHLVAEGGGVQVERDAEIVGPFLFEDLKEELDEAEDGIGGEAVLGREAVDGVEGAVHEAVPVDENESFLIHIFIVTRTGKFCKKKPEIA